jgi:hypothetical protein
MLRPNSLLTDVEVLPERIEVVSEPQHALFTGSGRLCHQGADVLHAALKQGVGVLPVALVACQQHRRNETCGAGL